MSSSLLNVLRKKGAADSLKVKVIGENHNAQNCMHKRSACLTRSKLNMSSFLHLQQQQQQQKAIPGYISRNIWSRLRDVIVPFSSGWIRLHLKYCIQCWVIPHQIYLIFCYITLPYVRESKANSQKKQTVWGLYGLSFTKSHICQLRIAQQGGDHVA